MVFDGFQALGPLETESRRHEKSESLKKLENLWKKYSVERFCMKILGIQLLTNVKPDMSIEQLKNALSNLPLWKLHKMMIKIAELFAISQQLGVFV